MIAVPYYYVLNDENSRNLFRNEDIKMKAKFYVKSLFVMIVLTAATFARYDMIGQDNLCSAAKFIYDRDDQRQGEFNNRHDSEVNESTFVINTKLTKGVNTKKKASMATKEAVTLAMLGTAIIAAADDKSNVVLRQKFNDVKSELSSLRPDTYRHSLVYQHYLALCEIEFLATDLAANDWFGVVLGELDVGACTLQTKTAFANLKRLTGIDSKRFIELYGIAKQAHIKGFISREVEHYKNDYRINDRALGGFYIDVVKAYAEQSELNRDIYDALQSLHRKLETAYNDCSYYTEPLTDLTAACAEREALLNQALIAGSDLFETGFFTEDLKVEMNIFIKTKRTIRENISERSDALSMATQTLDESLRQVISDKEAAALSGASAAGSAEGNVDDVEIVDALKADGDDIDGTSASAKAAAAVEIIGRGDYFTATYNVVTPSKTWEVKVRSKPYPTNKKPKGHEPVYVKDLNAEGYIETLKRKYNRATVTLVKLSYYN